MLARLIEAAEDLRLPSAVLTFDRTRVNSSRRGGAAAPVALRQKLVFRAFESTDHHRADRNLATRNPSSTVLVHGSMRAGCCRRRLCLAARVPATWPCSASMRRHSALKACARLP
jgi:hypothetical protein